MSGRLELLGRRRSALVGLAVLFLTPIYFDLDVVLEPDGLHDHGVLALSLALIWGYGGILCFGQSAFFGLGAYTYAIAMINIGESTVPLAAVDRGPGALSPRCSAISSSTAGSATSISA